MIRRKTDDLESKAFWEFVDRRAAAVDKWPAWKKGMTQMSEENTHECDVTRTRSESGTIFTVCDACWDRHIAPAAERNKKRGAYWLTPEGRKEIRETWSDPNDGNAVLPLLNALEANEKWITQLEYYALHGEPMPERIKEKK